MALGEVPTGFIAKGKFGLAQVTRNLEAIAHRLKDLERNAEAENFSLRAIVSSMVEGVMVVDTTGRILMANEALKEMFHFKAEVVGRTVIEVLRHPIILKAIDETNQKERGHLQEIELSDLVDEERMGRIFEMNSAPLHDTHGKLSGVVVVFHDISRIQQLEQVRQEFVTNVSHELRTPLSIFRGYLETLLETPDLQAKDSSRVLHALNRHSNRLTALVNDLLTLARLESGRPELSMVTLNIEQFFVRLKEDWDMLFSRKKCELVLDIGKGVESIEGDPLKLEQVVYNLLENALEYSAENEKIILGAKFNSEKRSIDCFVMDHGIGIPREKLIHIFERFYRVDKARSRDLGGTGLGLSIVKHVINLHKGEVWAESKLGKGTTIWFRLPLA
ncbi:MAG: ATP-binding protein [Verrucomicrobiota bacterium]